MHIPGQVGLGDRYNAQNSTFLWLCHNNNVHAREVIAARGVQCDTTCPLCRNGTVDKPFIKRVPFCRRILEEDRGASLFDFLLQLKLVGLVIPFCCLGVMET